MRAAKEAPHTAQPAAPRQQRLHRVAEQARSVQAITRTMACLLHNDDLIWCPSLPETFFDPTRGDLARLAETAAQMSEKMHETAALLAGHAVASSRDDGASTPPPLVVDENVPPSSFFPKVMRLRSLLEVCDLAVGQLATTTANSLSVVINDALDCLEEIEAMGAP